MRLLFESDSCCDCGFNFSLRHWSEVALNPTFLSWKRAYFAYKLHGGRPSKWTGSEEAWTLLAEVCSVHLNQVVFKLVRKLDKGSKWEYCLQVMTSLNDLMSVLLHIACRHSFGCGGFPTLQVHLLGLSFASIDANGSKVDLKGFSSGKGRVEGRCRRAELDFGRERLDGRKDLDRVGTAHVQGQSGRLGVLCGLLRLGRRQGEEIAQQISPHGQHERKKLCSL